MKLLCMRAEENFLAVTAPGYCSTRGGSKQTASDLSRVCRHSSINQDKHAVASDSRTVALGRHGVDVSAGRGRVERMNGRFEDSDRTVA
jgi:hypothetical protein